MTPPVDIAGLRGLVERATPGEWSAERMPSGDWATCAEPDVLAFGSTAADAAFIAAARSAVPALCDRVEELELERDDQRQRADANFGAYLATKEREAQLEDDLTAAREESGRLRAEVEQWAGWFRGARAEVERMREGLREAFVLHGVHRMPGDEAMASLVPLLTDQQWDGKRDGEGGVG